MPWFPQLNTGANVQFPVRRRIVRRTVLTEQPGGSVVKLADPDAAYAEWTLAFEGLTSDEMGAIEALFASCEGRRGEFVFLDPLDNLLAWSDEFTADVWNKDSGLWLGGGYLDPLGGTSATRVGGAGEMHQTIAAPSSLQYCFSIWARSDTAAELALIARAGAEERVRTVTANTAWQRFEYSTRLETAGDAITFGVRLAGGSEIELFGAQVDAQVAASRYKRTASRAGVYQAARFANDELEITTHGPNSHSCRLRVRAALEG